MKLKEYMEKYGISQKAMAQNLGVSRMWISRMMRGKVSISEKLALQIHQFTRGDVPLDEIIDICPTCKRKMP